MSIWSAASAWFASVMTQRSGVQSGRPLSLAADVIRSDSNSIDTALQVSTVWACVDLLARTISALPVYVYLRDGEKRSLARDSELWTLLHDEPNRRQGSAEFWRLMAANYALKGNAYARKTVSGGRVKSLWPLMADQMQVKELDTGALEYEYSINGSRTVYKESEILHIRGPGNGAIGYSRLDFMRHSVDLQVAAQNHSARTFRQKGRRPGLLFVPRVLNTEQRSALQQNFADLASGDKTLGVMEADMKYEGLGLSPSDMQLLETQRFSVEEICRWFGVPGVLVNDTSKSTTWGTGVGQIIEGFVKFSLRPELVIFEQALRKQLLPISERGRYEIEFGLDGLLRSNLKDRMDIYAKATQNGIYTRNEARQWENMPPIDGGEVLTAQTNLVPIDMLGKVPAGGGVTESPTDTSDAETVPEAQ